MQYLSLAEGSPDEWRHLLEVNVVALCLCTKEAVASMRRRDVKDGHIFNLSRSVLSLFEDPVQINVISEVHRIVDTRRTISKCPAYLSEDCGP
jgi:NAD(P)-dependent dehydrogenase (short-subunit alcohol dehydrogenase family)